jgi:signal transduction histidine kinase
VSCDHDAVLRVFGNLVGNAQKFTPPGGSITIGAELAGDAVKFSVSDTGPGIPAQDVSRLFQRGFRGERRGVGLGLGLAIARGIVKAHGGEIGVESEPGKGASFWFTLPVAGRGPARAAGGSGGLHGGSDIGAPDGGGHPD